MRYLITAGPTREPIDAVRFISNRSSGRMGLALAAEAADAGHDVTLLAGPGVPVDSLPASVTTHRFETTDDLQQLLDAHWPAHDVLVMAAAVADFRPVAAADITTKLPRESNDTLTLHLDPTPDLVAALAARKRRDQRIVAFALESPDMLEARAAEKLARKGVDAVVANPLTTMDAPDVAALWLTADGQRESPPRMSKLDFARWLIAKVDALTPTTPSL